MFLQVNFLKSLGSSWQFAPASRVESPIWLRRNRDKGRHGPTSAIRTRKGDGDASLSTVQLRVIQMNYDDYYARQVSGALPYFTGARVQGEGTGLEVCSVVS